MAKVQSISIKMEFKRISFDALVSDKLISEKELKNDLEKLINYDASENRRCFAGNKFLYHFQMRNMCMTKPDRKLSIYDIMNDEKEYQKLWDRMIKLNRTGNLENRLYEASRFNNAVVFFKATTAKYIYQRFKATSVLDPTAGWGGRMLGAYALKIKYTGFDTNINLKPAYDNMMKMFDNHSCQMLWEDCLKADFCKLDYDLVLTSPPYANLEIYEHMTRFESKELFYTQFLIPLLEKCMKYIKKDGYVCFNISPVMYSQLIRHKFKKCDIEIDMLQQKRLSNDKGDKIYCWKC